MAKKQTSKTAKLKLRPCKKGRIVLRSKMKPTHFTRKEATAVIAAVFSQQPKEDR